MQTNHEDQLVGHGPASMDARCCLESHASLDPVSLRLVAGGQNAVKTLFPENPRASVVDVASVLICEAAHPVI